jgi:hypothetical protein
VRVCRLIQLTFVKHPHDDETVFVTCRQLFVYGVPRHAYYPHRNDYMVDLHNVTVQRLILGQVRRRGNALRQSVRLVRNNFFLRDQETNNCGEGSRGGVWRTLKEIA